MAGRKTMDHSNNYKEILINLGYTNITENAKEFRTKPIYRDSDNDTVLRVRKDNGCFVDFARNISGSFEELVRLSLNLTNIDDAKKWILGKYQNFNTEKRLVKPEIKMVRTFDKENLLKLVHDHSYWINRGISEETIRTFKGGVITSGKMKDRYVFPIFNHKEDLIGVSGRDLINTKDGTRPKWKHVGDKTEWKFPCYINHSEIKEEKKVIVVESIGDMLALWDCNIKNVVVSFGLDISVPLINMFLRFDLSKIYLSFNNDSENNSAGNIASEKNKNKLLRYFDQNQVDIVLPSKKDFGEMTKEEIYQWKTQIK
jgi:hypothetical protein